MLGLLGLQARALSFQKDSFDRRRRPNWSRSSPSGMRANHLGFLAGHYTLELRRVDRMRRRR